MAKGTYARRGRGFGSWLKKTVKSAGALAGKVGKAAMKSVKRSGVLSRVADAAAGTIKGATGVDTRGLIKRVTGAGRRRKSASSRRVASGKAFLGGPRANAYIRRAMGRKKRRGGARIVQF